MTYNVLMGTLNPIHSPPTIIIHCRRFKSIPRNAEHVLQPYLEERPQRHTTSETDLESTRLWSRKLWSQWQRFFLVRNLYIVSCWTHNYIYIVKNKALTETQTLRAAYAGGVRPPSLYQIWCGLHNSFKSNEGGPKIRKLGHVTPATPTQGSVYGP